MPITTPDALPRPRLMPWAAAAGALVVPGLLLPIGGVTGIDRGLALVIAALTLFVATTVVAFAMRYLRADRRPLAFGATLGLLAGCVLTTVASASMVVLALAWIASGRLLARLIGHRRDWPEARAAARRAVQSFAIGDAALVAGLIVLARATGSLRIDDALARAAALPATVATPVALLLLVAAAARCALPPFAGWLGSSMTAPTPVSALMHAGLVNAGGFLLIRFAPVLEQTPGVRLAALAAGLVAALHGLGVMLVRPDIKRSLAGSTVSQMGFMVMSCALGAYAAALWHVVAHGLFKAWLFLGSGSAIATGKPPAAPAMARTIARVVPPVLALALILAATGQMSGARVPLVLALATGLVTLGAGLRSPMPMPARMAGVALLIVLAGSQALGLWLMTRAVRGDGPMAVPGWALALLLAGFLGGWLWQARRLALAPWLYVHLLNAGALRRTAQGDAG